MNPTDAEKPFDSSARADVILRSSDFVDFFALKSILSIASPVFDGMFSLDKGGVKEGDLDETKEGLSVVPLEEDSKTLYKLLQLIYPYEEGPTAELDVCTKVATAAQKYDMDRAGRKSRKMVLTCEAMEKEPLKVFMVGIHFGWVEVIQQSSLNTLSIPLRDLLCTQCKESTMTLVDLSDLITWRYACRDALRVLLSRWAYEPTRTFQMLIMEQLKETGCPHSTVLTDDSVVIQAMKKRPDGSKEIMSNRAVMKQEIEEQILRVPFKVRDIWVVRSAESQ